MKKNEGRLGMKEEKENGKLNILLWSNQLIIFKKKLDDLKK
jgi:hypothetical protein